MSRSLSEELSTTHGNDARTPASNLGQSHYAKSRRELLALLADLHATGVRQSLSLPQVAVVGAQSVGKSSLIEAISGVKVPRDTGTCTRCPLEVRLEHCQTQAWSCRVSLRIRAADGSQQDVAFASSAPCTTRRHRPSLSYRNFLDGSDRDFEVTNLEQRLSFTDNCVCIHIRGPDVTDLHFYDLPGLIVNVQEDQDPADIELVRSMVHNYVSRDSCIALLVVSCETDFENQTAGRLIRQLDPSGVNTVGVLTKPDRCDADTALEWQRINEKHRLESGWFVVKLPDATERMREISTAEISDNFFKSHEQWRAYAASNAAKVGTTNLAEHLADRLSAQLVNDLPRIHESISASLAATNAALASLPAQSIEDPIAEVLLRVTRFAQEISKRIQGTSGAAGQLAAGGLIQRLLATYAEFKDSVWRTVPVFDTRATEPETTASGGGGMVLQDFGPDGEPAMVEVERERVVTREQVVKVAKEARTRELPGNCPFVVKRHYIVEAVAKWQEPTETCFAAAGKVLLHELDNVLQDHFSIYSHGGLLARVRTAVHDHLQICAEQASAALRLELRKETCGPFTQNEHHLFAYKDIFLAHYKRMNNPGPMASTNQSSETAGPTASAAQRGTTHPQLDTAAVTAAALDALRQLGGAYANVTAADLARVLPTDDTDTALDIMAEVRAYFQVAYKRFIDAVPLTIEAALVREFDGTLMTALIQSLQLLGPEARATCERWVAEPPAVAVRRRELENQRRALEEASVLLNEFA
ncbi:P-loop containing nucleoside triphosphate hydrolase protein [Auriculariales sp. MPI-PUGE-AT-0066]|nr:P-loop containing nucleoside triphosphate hydrolase protein [Auriculariales sp. MPI-PUGE-AT-0066]